VPRLRKRSGRPPLSLLKAVQVRFAGIGCLRARTVRLRELLRCCKFTTLVQVGLSSPKMPSRGQLRLALHALRSRPMPGSRWIKVLHLRTRPRPWTRGKSSAWRTPKSTPMIRTFPMPAARS
jgi:hypothetical protein